MEKGSNQSRLDWKRKLLATKWVWIGSQLSSGLIFCRAETSRHIVAVVRVFPWRQTESGRDFLLH